MLFTRTVPPAELKPSSVASDKPEIEFKVIVVVAFEDTDPKAILNLLIASDPLEKYVYTSVSEELLPSAKENVLPEV